MDPKVFVKELNSNGLTVADAVNIQCQVQEKNVYDKLSQVANLTEHDWKLLQNILNLRHSFLKGHYNKNNITFKGTFDQSLTQMIESALEKADIPFKIRVVDSDWTASEDVLANTGHGLGTNLKFKYHMATSSVELKNNNLDVLLYISPHLKRIIYIGTESCYCP